MTDYVIWTRGLRGPSIAVLRGRSILGIDERKTLLSGPTPIKDEHAGLSLIELARLYPPPAPPPEPPMGPVLPAPHEDPPPSSLAAA